VVSGLDVQINILAAADANHFAIDGERMPRSVNAQVVAFAVQLFNVEILHVCSESGESPGHVLVVAGDDERKPRQRNAGSVITRRPQIGHIPGIGNAQRQVHIVREQRLATGGMTAGDDPVVRSRGAAVTCAKTQQGHHRRCRQCEGISCSCLRKVGVGVLTIVVCGRDNPRLRFGLVHFSAGGWVIAPGSHGIKIGDQPGIAKPGFNAGAGELGNHMGIESLHHVEAHADGIHAAPGLGTIHKQVELDGKRMGSFALRNEKIHAACVRVEALTVVSLQAIVDALGGEADLENALGFVILEERGTKDLGEFAIGRAAQAVHLPKAILGSHVALGNK
jgi:hypothetical protein